LARSVLDTKMVGMGMSLDELYPLGGTRFKGRRSSKEGDSAYKPSTLKIEDRPTLVIESGLSESLSYLRNNAE